MSARNDIRKLKYDETHESFLWKQQKSIKSCIALKNQKRKDEYSCIEPTKQIEKKSSRRSFLSQIVKSSVQLSVVSGSTFLLNPNPVYAGELGAKINAAVTQSELGISVRRSVVRGAQVIDKIDGSWEKFSDNFGLGAERSKQGSRPKPKIIPDPLPLDFNIANALLSASDSTFTSVTGINSSILQEKILKIDSTVRKSFERAGTSFNNKDENEGVQSPQLTSSQFNFFCYTHYRAYNELLIENKVDFITFRKQFEKKIGEAFANIILSNNGNIGSKGTTVSTNDTEAKVLTKKLNISLAKIDDIISRVRETGLVALADRNVIEDEQMEDWANNLSDLQFSVSLSKDATQSAQILLQEQGYRLYPDLIRFGIAYVLKTELEAASQTVVTDEYYMDTDYNSDPDKFSVKEVLLNIVIESI